MNNSDQNAPLTQLADRASQRPEYLGWIFGHYAKVEGATDQGFCARLGISALDLQRLHLCLRPRQASFAADLKQIATKFALDPSELARIIRHAEAIDAMKADSPELENFGLMLAARARSEGKINRQKGRSRGKRKK